MTEHPVERVERHCQWGRPGYVVLLLDAAIHQASVHGSHDGDAVPPCYAGDDPGLVHADIPTNYIVSDAWVPSRGVLPLFFAGHKTLPTQTWSVSLPIRI